MRHLLTVLGLLWAGTTAANEASHPAQALLIGGGMKICSSLSTKHCLGDPKFNRQALQSIHFQSTEQRLIATQAAWLKHFKQAMPENLSVLLRRFNHRHQDQAFTRREFRRRLQDIQVSAQASDQPKAGTAIIKALSDEQWYFLLDHYQKPRVDDQGRRIQEHVAWTHSNDHSKALVNQFVQLSQAVAQRRGREKTTILVSTASAGDVFDAVDFYLQLFAREGVEVHWLPLEAGLQALWHEQQSCAQLPTYRARISRVHDRDRVYPNLARFQQQMCQQPDHFRTLIETADGLFFNGGDQTLTLQSLAHLDANGTHFSGLYRQIKQRFLAGDLVLAGSSAGSAVMGGGHDGQQARPMINNGASFYGFINGAQARIIPPAACGGELGCDSDALSYLPSGGFDWLNLAVFDTHFAERDRPHRLARLLHDTGSPLGIGVDENTGLWLSITPQLTRAEVLGQGAVWIMHGAQSVSLDGSRFAMSIDLVVLSAGDRAQTATSKQRWQWQLAADRRHGEQHPWLTRLDAASAEAPVVLLNETVIQGETHRLQARIMPNPDQAWPHLVVLSTQVVEPHKP